MPFDGTLNPALERAFAARDLIASGWCQGASRSVDGRYCLIGAMVAGAGLSERFGRAVRLRTQAAGYATIQSWNDAPGRTQAEVLTLLDDVILELSHDPRS
jgi:hypothetical protein